MTSTPRVSVLIPSYNHARFLPAAIESALGQTFPDVEVLVADDGSSDGSLEVAERYAAAHPSRVRVVSHPDRRNHGIGATFNLALRPARGAYFRPFASDDVLCRDSIELQARYLDERPELGLVHGLAQRIDAGGNVLDAVIGEDLGRGANVLERLVEANGIAGLTVLLRRECLERVGEQDESLVYSDWEFWIRMAAHFEIGFLPRVLAWYRVHGSSTTASASREDDLDRALAVMARLAEVGPRAGGSIAAPRVQALVQLQTAYLCFSCAEREMALRALGLAFVADPSLRGDAAYLAGWLSRRPDLEFRVWLIEQLQAFGAGLERRLLHDPAGKTILEDLIANAHRLCEAHSYGEARRLLAATLRVHPASVADRRVLSSMTKLIVGRRGTAAIKLLKRALHPIH